MKTVYTYLVNFRDMGYTRDIPKNSWYISFISFFGIWNIPGISQNNSGTYNFSVFIWEIPEISPQITVHSVRGYILMFEFK